MRKLRNFKQLLIFRSISSIAVTSEHEAPSYFQLFQVGISHRENNSRRDQNEFDQTESLQIWKGKQTRDSGVSDAIETRQCNPFK